MSQSSNRYPVWESPGYALWQLTLRWRTALEEELAPLRLTTTQWTLLLALRRLIEDIQQAPTQRNLAAFAGVDQAMVSQVLKVLERRGLVARQFEDDDTRSKHLNITWEGERVVQSGLSKLAEVDARFFGPSLQQYPELLNKLRELVISTRLETATSDSEE